MQLFVFVYRKANTTKSHVKSRTGSKFTVEGNSRSRFERHRIESSFGIVEVISLCIILFYFNGSYRKRSALVTKLARVHNLHPISTIDDARRTNDRDNRARALREQHLPTSVLSRVDLLFLWVVKPKKLQATVKNNNITCQGERKFFFTNANASFLRWLSVLSIFLATVMHLVG